MLHQLFYLSEWNVASCVKPFLPEVYNCIWFFLMTIPPTTKDNGN